MSPWPGGHHSSPGSDGQSTGSSVSTRSFGSRCWQKSDGMPSGFSGGWPASSARLSSLVRNEFMRMSGACTPVAARTACS